MSLKKAKFTFQIRDLLLQKHKTL